MDYSGDMIKDEMGGHVAYVGERSLTWQFAGRIILKQILKKQSVRV
jgi:hypothetical protein